MLTASGSVIGVDVGCSPVRRSSAICRLDWSYTKVDLAVRRFRAIEPERAAVIADVAGGRTIQVAAFDGPLRRGLDVIGRYRHAERLLTRRLAPLIGKPGQSSTPVGQLLNHHANACARSVVDLGQVETATHQTPIADEAIVEAFPNAFLGLMLSDPLALRARRGDRSDVYYDHLSRSGTLAALVEHLLPGRQIFIGLRTITNHDDRAAVVCAMTALAVAAGEFVAVGDPEDGWIVLPPRRFIADLQWELLLENARETPSASLIVSEASGEKVVPLA